MFDVSNNIRNAGRRLRAVMPVTYPCQAPRFSPTENPKGLKTRAPNRTAPQIFSEVVPLFPCVRRMAVSGMSRITAITGMAIHGRRPPSGTAKAAKLSEFANMDTGSWH